MPPAPRPALRFEDLPLFASDEQIAEACVGADPEAIRRWVARVPALEAHGFPKKTHAYGRRYTPAVRRYYDEEYMPLVREGSREENPRWSDRRSRGLA